MRKTASMALAAALALAYGAEIRAQAPSSGSDRILMLDYENAADNPSFKSQRAFARLQQAAAWAVPKSKDSPPELKCKAVLLPPDGAGKFSVCTLKAKEVRISLPSENPIWTADPETVEFLTVALLFARAGLEPELASRKTPEWLVAALSRKAGSEDWRRMLPGAGGTQGAYALASRGIVPSLERILDNPLKPSDGESRELYEEYCLTVLEVCVRNGALRANLLEKVVLLTAKAPKRPQSEIFAEALGPALTREPSAPAGEAMKASLSAWFDQEMRRTLLNFFTPAAPQQIETLYRQVSTLSYKDANGAERLCPLLELPSKWDSIPDMEVALAGLMRKLTDIANMSPPEVQTPLLELQSSLSALRVSRGQKSADRLAKAEKSLFEALERRIALEALLKRCEARHSPPAARFEGLLDCLSRWQSPELSSMPRATRLLDAWDSKRGAR